MKQARRLVEEAKSAEFTDQSFQQVTRLLDQADTAYGRVLELRVSPQEYGIPVQDIAHLSLGNARWLRGVALQINNQPELAGEAFQEAIQILNQTLPAFQDSGLSRYLAQNRQFLGNAYQWSGNLSESTGDYPAAIQAYQQALEQLDACLALGENSPDRIIQSEIVEANCKPMHQQVEERLQVLSGGP